MKITLSKSQWEMIGEKAGWKKTAFYNWKDCPKCKKEKCVEQQEEMCEDCKNKNADKKKDNADKK